MGGNNLPLDLQNVDYDDVLHLYRGWRRSERALEERNREFDLLKAKTEQLKESHIRFRAQIQSLESVKEYTIKLQSDLTRMQVENEFLTKENKKLVESTSKAVSQSEELKSIAVAKNQAYKDAQSEAVMLRSQHEETMKEQKELQDKLSNEIASRATVETLLTNNDEVVDLLRAENNSLRKKMEGNVARMNECDEQLESTSRQITSLSEEVARSNEAKESMSSSEAEVGLLKGDISRLLRLMDHYPASKEFLQRWHVSDGMSFMGMGVPAESSSSALAVDYTALVEDGGEFDQFQDGPRDGTDDITPGEFFQLKKIHGGDPFPMTASFEDEAELWVPRRAAHVGLRFLAQKVPHAPSKLINEFLRKINKVWLKREERKFGDVKTFYDGQIADLRRQLTNLKPYRGIMAETSIRRLKTQVREEHSKVLKGRARKPTEIGNSSYFEEADDVEEHSVPHREGRLCERVAKKKGGGSVITVSKEKLLEASLLSLQTLGRRLPSDVTSSFDSDYADGEGLHPNVSYLRGAAWLGRNIVMVIEELAEALDSFRSKFLNEVTAAGSDTNLQRSRHRLNLLAATSINEALAVTNRGRVRATDLVQSAALIPPGDLSTYQEFIRTLPIDSSLPPPGPASGHSQGSLSRPSKGLPLGYRGQRKERDKIRKASTC